MMVRIPRADDPDHPVLVPGNPVKISGVPTVVDHRVPWLGEHTAEVLREELGLSSTEIEALRADSVIV
jgi:crotonobetainyl-CoA:carnitine CoA-transferase CaiB-like acyl-CoA transferase